MLAALLNESAGAFLTTTFLAAFYALAAEAFFCCAYWASWAVTSSASWNAVNLFTALLISVEKNTG